MHVNIGGFFRNNREDSFNCLAREERQLKNLKISIKVVNIWIQECILEGTVP